MGPEWVQRQWEGGGLSFARVGPDGGRPRTFFRLPLLGRAFFGGETFEIGCMRPSQWLVCGLGTEVLTQTLVIVRRSGPTRRTDILPDEGKALPQVQCPQQLKYVIFRPFGLLSAPAIDTDYVSGPPYHSPDDSFCLVGQTDFSAIPDGQTP